MVRRSPWSIARARPTAKNGLRFDNRYCWVDHFDGDIIDRYLASAMVVRLFEENPIQH
jgi:uncharacterized protein